MFENAETALATAKRWGNITDPAFDPDLTLLLAASKAIESFRPFAVAAFWIATGATTTRGLLYEATGEAKFLKPEELDQLILRLLALQEGFDSNLTGIPGGWDLTGLKATLCKGCTSEESINPIPFSYGLLTI
jgi:hypothetical protein